MRVPRHRPVPSRPVPDPYRPAAPDPRSPGAAPSGTDRKGTDPQARVSQARSRGTGAASDPFQPERYRPERRGADAERGTAQRRAPAHSAGPYETGPYDTGRYGAGPYEHRLRLTPDRAGRPPAGAFPECGSFCRPVRGRRGRGWRLAVPRDRPARPEGRQAAARARRTRRSIHRWGLALAGAPSWAWAAGCSSAAAAPRPSSPIPSSRASSRVSSGGPQRLHRRESGTLSQYLPGKRTVAAPASLDGGSASLCSWTLDAAPVYRLLNVQATAYAPNGLASETAAPLSAAIDGYDQALQQKMNPARARACPRRPSPGSRISAVRRSPRTRRPARPG